MNTQKTTRYIYTKDHTVHSNLTYKHTKDQPIHEYSDSLIDQHIEGHLIHEHTDNNLVHKHIYDHLVHELSTKTECDYPNGWIKKRPKWWTPEI